MSDDKWQEYGGQGLSLWLSFVSTAAAPFLSLNPALKDAF